MQIKFLALNFINMSGFETGTNAKGKSTSHGCAGSTAKRAKSPLISLNDPITSLPITTTVLDPLQIPTSADDFNMDYTPIHIVRSPDIGDINNNERTID